MLKRIRQLSPYVMLLGLLWSLPSDAWAHPLDVAYFDLSKNTTSTSLTVAVHPYQAFELVRAGSLVRFDLKQLRDAGELISAYVQNHVDIDVDGAPCIWDAGTASTPPSEIEAVADGVTIAGVLDCPKEARKLNISSDLFIDGFPNQQNIVRFELPDGYADRVTLTREKPQAEVDISELFASSTSNVSAATSTPVARSGGDYASLALRALAPGLNAWQWLGLLFSALIIGMLHALGPGHGKALMAAALMGEKPTFKKAMLLGGVMTATHVADVFLMALLAGAVSATISPGRFLAFLEYLSALALCVLGVIGLVRAILRYRRIGKDPQQVVLDEAHARSHALDLVQTQELEGKHFRKVLWTGFLGSLAPCPTAWAIFMATLSIGRWGVGLSLLVAFSIGLACTIIGLGCLMVISSAFMFKRTPLRLTYALPIISSTLITALGGWLLWRAL